MTDAAGAQRVECDHQGRWSICRNCHDEAVDAALARLRAVEGERDQHLPKGLMAEYTRLDMAWQQLVVERDAAQAEARRLRELVQDIFWASGAGHSVEQYRDRAKEVLTRDA